jgi:S-formylglutathione hydrolase FrmB
MPGAEDLARAQISITHQSGLTPAPGRYRVERRPGRRGEAGRVEIVLSSIPLVGWGPIIAIAAIAVIFLILAVLLWRNHKVWRWVFVFLFLVTGVAAVGDYVNTKFAYYDTLADLLGVPTYPTVDGNATGPDVQPQPNGAVTQITIPDTQSHFGSFQANVWLPPQYFTDTRAHFPVLLLLHGNPGTITDWLTSGGGPAAGLAVANTGKPVILVMPTVLQNSVTGDSLCVDTAAQGNAETYIVKDVVAAVDSHFRTNADAKHRGIGGASMGGFCSLNLGLKHPDVFSVVLDFSGDTHPDVDDLPGGIKELFGADFQQQVDANSPDKYYTSLNSSSGPAIWMDCGTADTQVLAQMEAFAPKLLAKGFTVEVHSRPGSHSWATWTAALQDALPWAAQKLSPPAGS